MQAYQAKDLKEKFEELKRLEDHTLAPILDVLISRWIGKLPDDSIVSDMQKEYSPQFSRNESYTCVVDGKIARLSIYAIDIDVKDDDESWYVAGSISFGGNEGAAGKLAGNFKEFVESQDIDELIKASIEGLKEGKTCHLSDEMYNFYIK